MFRTIQSFLIGAVGVTALVAQAHAADPGYCAQYARLALHELAVNQSIPGCFHGPDNRWNADWAVHYNWCLGAPYDAARSEDAIRGARLHECMFHAYGHY